MASTVFFDPDAKWTEDDLTDKVEGNPQYSYTIGSLVIDQESGSIYRCVKANGSIGANRCGIIVADDSENSVPANRVVKSSSFETSTTSEKGYGWGVNGGTAFSANQIGFLMVAGFPMVHAASAMTANSNVHLVAGGAVDDSGGKETIGAVNRAAVTSGSGGLVQLSINFPTILT